MEERRKAPRLEDENEITITVLSGGQHPPKEKVIYNRSKDISVSGARIQAHLFLPVDTLLMIEMTLKTVHQMITVIGKVKWIKIIYEDESYEAGVEFVNTPADAIQKLEDYISWKMKYKQIKPGC
ncbi:MAG TPA: PilZ domain-containing protein [Smithella sp.]|nr:PilZ domain-containing protein [Smithella sp.]HRS96767.1 PilZ domain-containing protein [Smithella sp.]